MHIIDGDGVDRVFYWVALGCTLVASKVFGFINVAYSYVEAIDLPEHDIKYLPQAEDLIPALIITFCCAAVSKLASLLIGHFWNKFFPKHATNK